MKQESVDRLKELEEKFERKKRRGNRLCWIKYNPSAEYSYDVEDADEDFRWMVFEIEQLREENQHYKEFIAAIKDQMVSELGINPDKQLKP